LTPSPFSTKLEQGVLPARNIRVQGGAAKPTKGRRVKRASLKGYKEKLLSPEVIAKFIETTNLM
jgi:hypothetical protein